MSSFKRKETIQNLSNRNPVRKWLGVLMGSLLLIILLWAAISSFRAYKAIQSLRVSQQKIELLMDGGLQQLNLFEAEDLVMTVREDLLTIRSAIGPAIGLAPLFHWVPKYGTLLENGPQLLDMADLGSEAALFAFRAAAPALLVLQQKGAGDGGAIPAVVQSLESSSADLRQALAALQQLALVREGIQDSETWPWEPQQLLAQLDSYLPLAEDAMILGRVFPALFGSERQKTYLLIGQNEDELRPTGGFISGAGILVIEDGNIVSIEFANANLIDDWQNKPYGFPPAPFNEFLGMDIFLFRDANFWPDFQKSAITAMQLYNYGQDSSLDGVIAFNQNFLQMLIEATGPLYVPELDITVDSGNVIQAMREEWGPADGQTDWINQRKAFMGPFAKAFTTKITGNLESLDMATFGQRFSTAVERRDIQFFMLDTDVAEALSDAGWDGQLSSVAGQDYLMIVETNLGFNKANAAVDRDVSYKVKLDEDGQASARLKIDYEHTSNANAQECEHGTVYSADTKYEDLIADCYWNYLRVFVPEESLLLNSSEHPVSADKLLIKQPWDGKARTYHDFDAGYTYFDNFFLLPAGQSTTVDFDYMLPDVVTTGRQGVSSYRLAIDKQSGIGKQFLKFVLTLPTGSEFISSSPVPSSVNGQDLIFEHDQVQDMQINVHYR